MKPLKPPTYLVQNLLIAAATALALIGFLFAGKIMHFWPAIWGYVMDGNMKQPVVLGVVPLQLVCSFFSFLLLYLLYEMYGLKSAFYALLGIAATIAGAYALMDAIKMAPMDPDPLRTDYDLWMRQLINPSRRDLIAWLIGWSLGHTVTFTLTAFFKQLTRGYFMFLRYTLAVPVGFVAVVALQTYVQYVGVYAPRSMLVYAATPLAQYLVLTALCLVPLYILRLFLGLFRGRMKNATPEPPTEKKPKSLFKTETVIPTVPTQTPPPPPAQAVPTKVYELSDNETQEIRISDMFSDAKGSLGS